MDSGVVVSVGVLFSSFRDDDDLVNIVEYMKSHFKYYEIIVAANPSEIQSCIEDKVLAHASTRLIVLNDDAPDDILKKNILKLAIGDAVVLLDPQEIGCDVIETLVQTCLDGNDFVGVEYSKVNSSYTLFKRSFFFVISKISGYSINSNASNTGCYGRSLVNAINTLDGAQGDLKLSLATVGFKEKMITGAEQEPRSLSHILHRLGNSLDFIGAASHRLLMAVAWLSFGACLGNFIYLCYVIGVWLFAPSVQRGWTTLSLTQSLFFMILFFALFVFSCIFAQQVRTKSQKRYSVARDVSKNEFITTFNSLNVTDNQ